MSEEEKKAIETVENFIKYYKDNEQTGNRANLDVLGEEVMAIEFILNKYDVQENEIDNIKEIEKTHKEENGKLRVEFEKVYQDNLTLAHELEQYKLLEANIDKANKIIAENKFDEGLYDLLMKEKEKNELFVVSGNSINLERHIKNNYISKEKLKEKLELLKDILKAKEKDGNIYKQIPIEYLKGAIEQLENLLEDK